MDNAAPVLQKRNRPVYWSGDLIRAISWIFRKIIIKICTVVSLANDGTVKGDAPQFKKLVEIFTYFIKGSKNFEESLD